jgi:hypothetical protein
MRFGWSLERLGDAARLDISRAPPKLREQGAEPSFPTIVAAESALCRTPSRAREIGRGELVVFSTWAPSWTATPDGTRTSPPASQSRSRRL